MELTINVQVSMNPELIGLVRRAIDIMHPAMPAPNDTENRQPAFEPDDMREKPETPAKAEPQAEEPVKLEKKTASMEDIRHAMHEARIRIEGEDYKDNPDGEGYKKYHKALTAAFKGIAAVLGADKPSALPEDKRVAFIGQCNELVVKEDGTVGVNVPF